MVKGPHRLRWAAACSQALLREPWELVNPGNLSICFFRIPQVQLRCPFLISARLAASAAGYCFSAASLFAGALAISYCLKLREVVIPKSGLWLWLWMES